MAIEGKGVSTHTQKHKLFCKTNWNINFFLLCWRYKKECIWASGRAGDPIGDHEDGGEKRHAGLDTGGTEAEGEGWRQGPGEPCAVQRLRIPLGPSEWQLGAGETRVWGLNVAENGTAVCLWFTRIKKFLENVIVEMSWKPFFSLTGTTLGTVRLI